MNTVCPLGLCRTKEDCPRAPCMDCMRRLGERIIEEIKLLQRQSQIAQAKGDRSAVDTLRSALAGLGSAISRQENTGSVHTG